MNTFSAYNHCEGSDDLKYETFEKRALGIAAILICIFFGLAAIYFFFKYGFAIFLPFLIGWSVSLVIVPLAKRLSGKNEGRGKAVSVILFLILISLVVVLLALAFDRLIFEVQRLMERFADDSAKASDIIDKALDFAASITEHIPFLDRLAGGEDSGIRQRIDGFVSDVISDFVTGLTTKIPVWFGAVIGAFPSIILFIIVTLISGFYFCIDLGNVHAGIKSVLPRGVAEKLTPLKRRITGTAMKYLRAYVLLLLLTFGELFIGFSILGIDYALLLAALIAIIDILPVLGVGSVLIPWAVILLISGNYYHGIGLLIIYACVTIIRQISEPKIVGGSLGIHPLLTLISMYAGFKLFGIFGMILGPAAALAVKSVFFTPRGEEGK